MESNPFVERVTAVLVVVNGMIKSLTPPQSILLVFEAVFVNSMSNDSFGQSVTS